MTEQLMEKTVSSEKLIHWMKLYLANLLGENYTDIDENVPIREFDLDSIDAVTIMMELENAFSIKITPEYFFNRSLCLVDIANDIVTRG